METALLITLVVGATSVVVLLVVAGILAWRSYLRRRVVALVARSEALTGVMDALVSVMSRLADMSDEELSSFCTDSAHPERNTFLEIVDRSGQLSAELDSMALPRSAVDAARLLADAAHLIGDAAQRVRDAQGETRTLEAISSLELEGISSRISAGLEALAASLIDFGIDDASVYGGGMYL